MPVVDEERVEEVARRLPRRASSCRRSRRRGARETDGRRAGSCSFAADARPAARGAGARGRACLRCAVRIASLLRRMRTVSAEIRLRMTPGIGARRLQNSAPGRDRARALPTSRRCTPTVGLPSITDSSPTLSPGRIGMPRSGDKGSSSCAASCPTSRKWIVSFALSRLHQDRAGRHGRGSGSTRAPRRRQPDRCRERSRSPRRPPRVTCRPSPASCRLRPADADREMVAAVAAAVAQVVGEAADHRKSEPAGVGLREARGLRHRPAGQD